MRKLYFEKLNTNRYKELRKVELESVDELQRSINELNRILNAAEAFAKKADGIEDEFNDSFAKAKKLWTELQNLELSSLRTKVQKESEIFDDLGNKFETAKEKLEKNLEQFGKNIEQLGLKPEGIPIYDDARALNERTSIERFGDDYGLLIDANIAVKSQSFKMLADI